MHFKDQDIEKLTGQLKELESQTKVLEIKVNEAKKNLKHEVHNVKEKYKYKLSKLTNEKDALYEYNKDIEFKNQ